MLTFLLPRAPFAQGRTGRTLRSLEVSESATGWDLELALDIPARYLRHSPIGSGRLLRIQVERLDVPTPNAPRLQRRDILPLPRDRQAPIVEIAFDQTLSDGPFIEIQFSRSVSFRVSQGDGLRSIRILLEDPERAPAETDAAADAAAGAGAGTSAVKDPTKSDALLERARVAIRDGELDVAIALLTKILESRPEDTSIETRQQAQELLGVTHERRGQLAHARAEYEAYLTAYPDGPAAERVRQRLDALVTAGAAPRPALRQASSGSRDSSKASSEQPIETDLFGSLAVTYFRTESILEDEGRDFLASDVLADIDLAGRVETDDWVVRTDLIGTYDIDVADEERTDDLRFSRLSVEVEDRTRGIEVTVGRQGRSDSGVLGRFDGLYGSYRIGSHYAISALVGAPVESTSDSKPNTDTVMGGAALDFEDIWLEGLRGQLFVVGQNTEGMTDRTAIGGELRYSNPQFYTFGYLDYDVVFNSLNAAILSSTYYWKPETDFRFLVERRNSPVLTVASALQGRGVGSIGDLQDQFSDSEIRDLAKDRIVSVWTGTFGTTHRPNDRLQISGDFTITHSSDTKTSDDGVVPGIDSSGPDFNTSVQFLVNDWLADGGVGSVTARYFEGERSRTVGLSGFSRFLLFNGFRINPRLRWDYRDSDFQGASSSLVPSIETDWRYKSFLVHVDFGVQWLEPMSGSDIERETNYFLEVGLRWEF